jgi:hypothetical protein
MALPDQGARNFAQQQDKTGWIVRAGFIQKPRRGK